jgi:hypothetical protein
LDKSFLQVLCCQFDIASAKTMVILQGNITLGKPIFNCSDLSTSCDKIVNAAQSNAFSVFLSISHL